MIKLRWINVCCLFSTLQLISQLLMEMDSCGKGVVVLAATNHPETIDASILRPGKKRADLFFCMRCLSVFAMKTECFENWKQKIGRLDRLAYVPPPTFEERVAILEILRQGTRFSENIDLRTVSNLTMNFTGADLKALVRKAGLYALKANRVSSFALCTHLHFRHFLVF